MFKFGLFSVTVINNRNSTEEKNKQPVLLPLVNLDELSRFADVCHQTSVESNAFTRHPITGLTDFLGETKLSFGYCMPAVYVAEPFKAVIPKPFCFRLLRVDQSWVCLNNPLLISTCYQ